MLFGGGGMYYSSVTVVFDKEKDIKDMTNVIPHAHGMLTEKKCRLQKRMCENATRQLSGRATIRQGSCQAGLLTMEAEQSDWRASTSTW